ncbi:hypothetical protein TNCV_2814221 [Trichonephila clavipes]|nr:hypothetical protein TNCV_2814221 [Trichonephila clavipes]
MHGPALQVANVMGEKHADTILNHIIASLANQHILETERSCSRNCALHCLVMSSIIGATEEPPNRGADTYYVCQE